MLAITTPTIQIAKWNKRLKPERVIIRETIKDTIDSELNQQMPSLINTIPSTIVDKTGIKVMKPKPKLIKVLVKLVMVLRIS